MEGYAARKPAASADAGLTVLAGELTGLVGELAGAGPAGTSFDEIEQLVMVRGRALLRKVIQHVMAAGAAAEPRLAGVADAAGMPRPRAERGHARTMISQVGPAVIERMAYRAPGQPNLHPRDAVLNLPPRRDPRHDRTWVALADGDNHQIEMIRAQAAARGIDLVIVIDFIHVLEYLWKAAWCFHPPRDPAIEAWVTARALDILHGRAAQVTETIRQLAASNSPPDLTPKKPHPCGIVVVVSGACAPAR